MTQRPVGEVVLRTASGRGSAAARRTTISTTARSRPSTRRSRGEGQPSATRRGRRVLDGASALAGAASLRQRAGRRARPRSSASLEARCMTAMAFPSHDRRRGRRPDPRRRRRHGVVVLSGLGCPDAVLAAHRRALRRARAIRATSPRCIRSPPATCTASRASTTSPGRACSPRILAGSYPSGPSSRRAAGDLADDHRQRRSPPTTSPRASCSTCTARRRPSGPGVLTKVGLDTFVDPEREGCAMNAARRGRADRHAGSTSTARTGCTSRRSCPTSRSSAPPRPTSAATSPTSTRAPISAPLDQALAARNNGGIVIAQVKRLAESGTLKPHDVRVPGHPGRCHRRRARPDADDADAPTTRPSPARSSGRCRASRLPEFGVAQGDRAARRAGAAAMAMPSISASASRPTCRASCSRKAGTATSPG